MQPRGRLTPSTQVTGRQRVRGGLVLIMCAGVLAGCGTREVGTAPAGGTTLSTAPSVVQAPPPTLAPRAKELIDAAKQARLESVVLTISTVQGETDTTARALRDLGATVESTDATVGYIRASVPIDVAAQATTLKGISRVDVEEPIGVPDPTP